MEKLDIQDGISAVYGKFKNAGMVPHFHESYSIGIITEGEYHYKSGSKEAILKAGETRIVAPYELHETYAGEWEYLHFDIDPNLLLSVVKDINQDEQVLTSNILQRYKQEPILNISLELYSSLKNSEILEIESNFSKFSTVLLKNSHSLNLTNNLSLDSLKLGKAIEYIFTFWDNPHLSVEAIAKVVGFSLYYFIRSFKKEFKITPHKYIQSLRVERAKYKIIKTNEPLAQISIECGFSDQSHMNRVFKRIAGFTPNILRT